jgi:hypothetical protein
MTCQQNLGGRLPRCPCHAYTKTLLASPVNRQPQGACAFSCMCLTRKQACRCGECTCSRGGSMRTHLHGSSTVDREHSKHCTLATSLLTSSPPAPARQRHAQHAHYPEPLLTAGKPACGNAAHLESPTRPAPPTQSQERRRSGRRGTALAGGAASPRRGQGGPKGNPNPAALTT